MQTIPNSIRTSNPSSCCCHCCSSLAKERNTNADNNAKDGKGHTHDCRKRRDVRGGVSPACEDRASERGHMLRRATISPPLRVCIALCLRDVWTTDCRLIADCDSQLISKQEEAAREMWDIVGGRRARRDVSGRIKKDGYFVLMLTSRTTTPCIFEP